MFCVYNLHGQTEQEGRRYETQRTRSGRCLHPLQSSSFLLIGYWASTRKIYFRLVLSLKINSSDSRRSRLWITFHKQVTEIKSNIYIDTSMILIVLSFVYDFFCVLVFVSFFSFFFTKWTVFNIRLLECRSDS